jgi:hypothetical protein
VAACVELEARQWVWLDAHVQALRACALGLVGVHAGQQLFQRQAHHLLGLQAQHAGHGRVGQRHAALGVQAQDGIGRGVDDGGGALFALAQRLQLLVQRRRGAVQRVGQVSRPLDRLDQLQTG